MCMAGVVCFVEFSALWNTLEHNGQNWLHTIERDANTEKECTTMEAVMRKTPVWTRLARWLVGTQSQEADDKRASLPSLEQELRDCLERMRHNEQRFDMELEPELIEEVIYEYQALQSRYRYLQRKARANNLRAIL